MKILGKGRRLNYSVYKIGGCKSLGDSMKPVWPVVS